MAKRNKVEAKVEAPEVPEVEAPEVPVNSQVLPVWYGAVEAAGAAKGEGQSKLAAAIDAIREAGGLPSDTAARDAEILRMDAAYLTGYLSTKDHAFASFVRMDKATFKKLDGEAKDRTSEKGKGAHARKLASDAIYQFRVDVLKAFPTQVENSGEGEGETAEATAKSEADLIAAYKKKVENAEKQVKAALQALRDAGIKVKAEALVTKAFDAIRTPEELTTREG